MRGGLPVPAVVAFLQELRSGLGPVQAEVGRVEGDHPLGKGVGGQPVIGLCLDGPQVAKGNPGGLGDIVEAQALLLAQQTKAIAERALRLGLGDRGMKVGHGCRFSSGWRRRTGRADRAAGKAADGGPRQVVRTRGF